MGYNTDRKHRPRGKGAVMHTHRNPTDLLGLNSDPRLQRLLRACGIDEAYVTGGASDYDKFLALAAALPLCEGHPLRDAVNATLTAATGLSMPLCPHTAHAHWDAWVETHLYGKDVTAPAILLGCPSCTRYPPMVLRERDLTRLPVPKEVKAADLAEWSDVLEKALPQEGFSVFTIPADYTFTRPNPYHAGLAVTKINQGVGLTETERSLLVTQALRVWGLTLAERVPHTTSPLLLLGGTPEAVVALLAYLNASHALPPLVWIPHDPMDAGAVSGLYPQVGTGYAVAKDALANVTDHTEETYAKIAPVGRAVRLIL